MTKPSFLLSATSVLLGGAMLSGCSTMKQTTEIASAVPAIPQGTGYFAQDSALPFHAPDFTRIKDADFKPAFEQAMAIHKAEVEAIKSNPDTPSFENTIVALETSGKMLARVANVFFALTGSNTNDTLDTIDAEISPALSAHGDAITLDPVLFARVKAVYDQCDTLGLDTEDAKLLEETYKGMVHAGAMLDDAQKQQVKAINTRLSEISTAFSQKLVEANNRNALVVDSAGQLAGLSDGEIEAARKAAAERGLDGKFLIALQNTTQQPDLANLTNRETREKLFSLSIHRADTGGENDTRALIAEIAQLRAQ